MAKKKTASDNSKSGIVNFYGTKAEWVKAELDISMSEVFDNAFKEKVVVAEDEKGLYLTGKSYVGAPLLDPYRMYHRRQPIVNEDGTYSVSK